MNSYRASGLLHTRMVSQKVNYRASSFKTLKVLGRIFTKAAKNHKNRTVT